MDVQRSNRPRLVVKYVKTVIWAENNVEALMDANSMTIMANACLQLGLILVLEPMSVKKTMDVLSSKRNSSLQARK